MIVIPAFDVSGSECLVPGASRFATPVRWSDDPLELVRSWQRLGFGRFLARTTGETLGFGVCASLADQGRLLWQGGARSEDEARHSLESGADCVVVCASLLADGDWVLDLAQRYPGRVVVAAEVADGMLRRAGSARGPARRARDVVADVSDADLGGVLVACVDRQGAVQLADLPLLEDVVEAVACPVLARTEVSQVGELRALADRGVAAAVLGATLHEQRIDPYRLAQFDEES